MTERQHQEMPETSEKLSRARAIIKELAENAPAGDSSLTHRIIDRIMTDLDMEDRQDATFLFSRAIDRDRDHLTDKEYQEEMERMVAEVIQAAEDGTLLSCEDVLNELKTETE